jgi:hypothetical protein
VQSAPIALSLSCDTISTQADPASFAGVTLPDSPDLKPPLQANNAR